MKYQIPEMLKNGGGSMVNMASVAGLIGSPGASVYVASKQTAMADRILEVIPMSVIEATTPMGRLGKPDEIALAVQFLLDPANSYMTGQCVTVDGGWTAQ